jgi:hypothetical protein
LKTTKQAVFAHYVARSLSEKDKLHFENLVLRMVVSNGLSFTFTENQETKDVFNFIIPTLKLPNRRAISDRILPKISKNLTKEILQQACADKIGITAAFDGWTNIKREHLFGVVLITSRGKTLIWSVRDISNQRSKTENAKLHIENIMNDANEKGIKINCYVSDSSGEYAAARQVLNKYKYAET